MGSFRTGARAAATATGSAICFWFAVTLTASTVVARAIAVGIGYRSAGSRNRHSAESLLFGGRGVCGCLDPLQLQQPTHEQRHDHRHENSDDCQSTTRIN